MDQVYDTIIIGGGLAALSAGIWLGRAGINHLIFSGYGHEKYGLLATTAIVENFPGFESIDGKSLVKKISKQAVKYGSVIIEKYITKVDFLDKPFKVFDQDGIEYKSFSIIVATGSVPNRLNLENENKVWGKYISTCTPCDAPHFKGKKVIVVGGGDASLETALLLTKFAKTVTLIHRRNIFTASLCMQKKVLKHPKVKVICDHSIVKINCNDHKLTSVTCLDQKHNRFPTIEADAIFYALGFQPNNHLFPGILKLDKRGYIVKDKENECFEHMTSVDGVFVAGDVSSCKFKQAILAAADGVETALEVNNYLHDLHIVHDIVLTQ